MKTKLTDLIFHLDDLSNTEIMDLRKHYLKYSQECGECINCELKYHILEVYALHKMKHIPNRRSSQYDRIAEDFIHVKYDKEN